MSSRLATIACSFVAASLVAAVSSSGSLGSLGSLAFADRAEAPVRFAQPPPAARRAIRSDSPVLDHDALVVVLRAARATNLAAFRAYAAAGVYPSNTYKDSELNVWRDRDGHLCAAATIISQSGATELVDRVADQNNFIRLADVKQGPLENWILTSGFTQEELVLIQRPFRPVPVLATPSDPRGAETARLKTLYKQIDAQLVKDEAASLDLAATRLLAHPTLAWPLVANS